MTKSNRKHNTIVLCVAAVISVTILILAFAKKNTNRHTYSYQLFQGTKGWGYDILMDEVIFIHQERIPVLPTDSGFKKKEQAEQAAKLMLEKLKTSKLPFVSVAEMEQICKE